MAWISNYSHVKQWYVLTHPWPNLKGGLVKTIENYGCNDFKVQFNCFIFQKVHKHFILQLRDIDWGDWQKSGAICSRRTQREYSLQWRQNGRDCVSNHQPRHCLLSRLFGRRSKKTSKLRVTGLCAGNQRGPVNSPHKWPVTRKMFPFDDVIMSSQLSVIQYFSKPRDSFLSVSRLVLSCLVLSFLVLSCLILPRLGLSEFG